MLASSTRRRGYPLRRRKPGAAARYRKLAVHGIEARRPRQRKAVKFSDLPDRQERNRRLAGSRPKRELFDPPCFASRTASQRGSGRSAGPVEPWRSAIASVGMRSDTARQR